MNQLEYELWFRFCFSMIAWENGSGFANQPQGDVKRESVNYFQNSIENHSSIYPDNIWYLVFAFGLPDIRFIP